MIAVPSNNLRLPTAAELPDSDETPVDNELQNETPNLLLEILRWIWRDRSDWFWGVDMAVYGRIQVNQWQVRVDAFDGIAKGRTNGMAGGNWLGDWLRARNAR